MILKDDIGVVVCEDLMGRYNLNYKTAMKICFMVWALNYYVVMDIISSRLSGREKNLGLFGYHGDKTHPQIRKKPDTKRQILHCTELSF